MNGEPFLAVSDDVADGELIDLRSWSLTALLNDLDESSLARALKRIFASSEQNLEQLGFSNCI
jgi:hypothetical protein